MMRTASGTLVWVSQGEYRKITTLDGKTSKAMRADLLRSPLVSPEEEGPAAADAPPEDDEQDGEEDGEEDDASKFRVALEDDEEIGEGIREGPGEPDEVRASNSRLPSSVTLGTRRGRKAQTSQASVRASKARLPS